jgi:hypothetical protein
MILPESLFYLFNKIIAPDDRGSFPFFQQTGKVPFQTFCYEFLIVIKGFPSLAANIMGWITGIVGLVLAVLAGMLLSSVISGHCPLYVMLGIRKTI